MKSSVQRNYACRSVLGEIDRATSQAGGTSMMALEQKEEAAKESKMDKSAMRKAAAGTAEAGAAHSFTSCPVNPRIVPEG